jgi:hypothetical protein
MRLTGLASVINARCRVTDYRHPTRLLQYSDIAHDFDVLRSRAI